MARCKTLNGQRGRLNAQAGRKKGGISDPAWPTTIND
jgi:hypothetical protein